MNDTKYVIFSVREAERGAGFWSNEIGWCKLESATKFTNQEKDEGCAIINLRSETCWIPVEEVEGREFFRLFLLDEDAIDYEFLTFAKSFDEALEQAHANDPSCICRSTRNEITGD